MKSSASRCLWSPFPATQEDVFLLKWVSHSKPSPKRQDGEVAQGQEHQLQSSCVPAKTTIGPMGGSRQNQILADENICLPITANPLLSPFCSQMTWQRHQMPSPLNQFFQRCCDKGEGGPKSVVFRTPNQAYPLDKSSALKGSDSRWTKHQGSLKAFLHLWIYFRHIHATSSSLHYSWSIGGDHVLMTPELTTALHIHFCVCVHFLLFFFFGK